MLSLEYCKSILIKSGTCYSQDEVKMIRDLLYDIGKLDYNIVKHNFKQNEERHYLHSGIYGRTG